MSHQHEKAIEMFKKMLQQAWILKDSQLELKAYLHLGYEHFYIENFKKDTMGTIEEQHKTNSNLSKSKYYIERYNKGKVEEEDSIVKLIYLQDDKINKHRYYIEPNLDIEKLKDEPCKRTLPSPSEGRHKIKDVKIENTLHKVNKQSFLQIRQSKHTRQRSQQNIR